MNLMERGSEMLTRETIRQFILSELISDDSSVDLTDTVQLIDSGVIDSFGIMSLLGFLEEKFSIQISGDDLVPENFASISTISDFVTQKSC
jgi:acyl carrier protein